MKYIKITKKNADSILIIGSILAHHNEILEVDEADDISDDLLLEVVKQVDTGRIIKVLLSPPADKIIGKRYLTAGSRIEIDDLSDGYWWVKK